MPLRKNHRQLLDEATAKITTLTVDQARARLDDPHVLFVDIRDPRELDREGQIPGAFHATRGMLEFWVDPDSPYFKPQLGEGRELVLYCQSVGGRPWPPRRWSTWGATALRTSRAGSRRGRRRGCR